MNRDVDKVMVPGKMGSFEILENHANLISSLDNGIIQIKEKNSPPFSINIDSGVVQIKNNEIVILILGDISN